MPNIHILDKTIANRISAGEVVEKPASVVKELVENSIDAGAKNISIYVYGGGIDNITIIDDGCGIEREQVALAFLPHATSKINKAEDLYSISTLGFRGEALSSITAVSQVEIYTKTEEEQIGTKVSIVAGEVECKENFACNKGTKIIVKNLFFNTPARKKFLRKPKLEESEITKLIEKFILAQPSIKFKYYTDDKLIYNTTGCGLFDCIYTIYGKEVSDNLLEVDFKYKDYHISGFIGNTQISKPNRTYQTLFVNKRIVINFLISSAIQTGYDDFLMKGQFPFYVLNLSVPYDNVDINIHPTKQEVKFENSNEIYGLFVRAVHEKLIGIQHIKNLKLPTEKPKEKVDLSKEFSSIVKPTSRTEFSTAGPLKFASTDSNEYDIATMLTKSHNLNNDNQLTLNKKNNYEQIANTVFKEFENSQIPFKVIGSIFSTYIIIEKGDVVYLIDQHACHERKLYDNFVEDLNKNSELITQELLVPYSFTCNQDEWQFFNENMEAFKNLGFTFEEFGDKSFIISAVPYIVNDIDLQKFIIEIKSNLGKFNKSKTDILKDYLAQTACKAAVKGGDNLSQNEINALLKDLDEHKVLLCPHGRPIVVEIKKTEVEKWFKRIV